MMMRRALAVLAFALAGALPPSASAETPAFEVGQVWTLEAPMASTARVSIGRIEDNGEVIHISVWGQPVAEELPVPNPFSMSHLPIARASLSASVDTLVTESLPTDLRFEEGYGLWRDAQGGVFTITVAEILEVVLQNIPPPDAQSK
jgi:hypothetical protein